MNQISQKQAEYHGWEIVEVDKRYYEATKPGETVTLSSTTINGLLELIWTREGIKHE